MSRKIENTPSPNILMNSLRSIGYTFPTAIADIVDNSISANAKNINIYFPINEDELYITILDDGNGMSSNELFNAMKYGSEKDNYSKFDLGRFGLGLKSASLSCCKVLTVVSKMNNSISAYQWDYDTVTQSKKWDCLELDEDEINNIPDINKLKNLSMGTLVVWQDFDIAYKKSNGRVQEYLANEMELTEKNLRLVFHRFLKDKFKPLNIFINGNKLLPFDPFLEEHPKTDTKKPSEINIDDSIIRIQTYILPHQSDLSKDDIENKLGGIESLRKGQGFYIYRNDRLIIYGSWFRLSTNALNSELLKYGRIKVDIPNSLDDIWDIDIKKQNASIPKQILNNLKQSVLNVCRKSEEKTKKRTKLTINRDDNKIWNKALSENKNDTYFINKDSHFIKNFIDEFDDKDKRKLLDFLDIISANIPFNDIYNSICNNKYETKLNKEQRESIILEGIAQFKLLKKIQQKSNEDIFDTFKKYEPFNEETIYKEIWRRINSDK